ncbi:MAG: DUF1836 domain-containing protein [Syntrophomonadaceae bacterium]|nr:DUF1836 domain-containing protein [Syntrophomonadaceae bacterium]
MDFDKSYLQILLKECALPEMKISDMPEIDLYMEQLTQFLENKYKGIRRDQTEKILTRTMINNYSKMGLLMPPINKHYGKEHIVLLILIYNLKNVLSINDIKLLFSPILNNVANREDDILFLEDIYNTFLELNNIEFDNFYNSFAYRLDLIKEKTRDLDQKDQDIAQLFLFIIMLVAQSNAQKKLAEKLIDEFFAPPKV